MTPRQERETHLTIISHLKVRPAKLMLSPSRRFLARGQTLQHLQRLAAHVEAELVGDSAKRCQQLQKKLPHDTVYQTQD
jgi:hypothetical protein